MKLERVKHANELKLKVKKLLTKIDGSGIILAKLFFDILELHEITICERDKRHLIRNFGCNKTALNGCDSLSDQIRFKESLSLIYIDLESLSL